MFDIQGILDLDRELLLSLNGSNSLFWDGFFWTYTGRFIWIPLAAFLVYVLFKNKGWKSALLIVCSIALVVALADQVSSSFFKPLFQRFRPTQEPSIMYLVDVVNGYRGGKYGFISSHACNSFGIVTFAALLIRSWQFTSSMLCWAILNCLSRIYLGVHYLGDIVVGTIVGILIGYLVYQLYKLVKGYVPEKAQHSSPDNYSASGYLVSDINLLLSVLLASFFAIVVIGMVTMISI